MIQTVLQKNRNAEAHPIVSTSLALIDAWQHCSDKGAGCEMPNDSTHECPVLVGTPAAHGWKSPYGSVRFMMAQCHSIHQTNRMCIAIDALRTWLLRSASSSTRSDRPVLSVGADSSSDDEPACDATPSARRSGSALVCVQTVQI